MSVATYGASVSVASPLISSYAVGGATGCNREMLWVGVDEWMRFLEWQGIVYVRSYSP